MDAEDLERGKILAETSRIPWRELQRYFAGGRVVAVAPGLDLVEVAYQISRDNSREVERWINGNTVARVEDSQALAWFEADVLMWAVVVKPWVLVQPAGGEVD